MLRFAQIRLGRGESVSCSRCHEAGAETFFSAEEIDRRMTDITAVMRRHGGANVALVGPEPFKHPALPRVVASAVAHGFERVRLRTDGGALSIAGNASGVLGAGVHQVEVVVLGPDASVHDKLAGTPGLFDAARNGVRAYLAAGESTGAPVVVTSLVRLCRHNVSLLPAIVAQVVQWGVVCIALEPADGVLVPDGAVREARQTAMAAGVWLAGTDDAAVGIEPWGVWEADR